jgi:hypothetical protein
MGYNPKDFFKGGTSAGKVVTTYDPSVITRKSERKVMSNAEIAEYSREASRGTGLRNAQSNMGLSSSMGKSDRQTALLAGVKKGSFKSVAQIAMALNVQEPTVKKYLKELKIDFDSATGKIISGN